MSVVRTSVFLIAFLASACARPREPVPVLGTLPEFALVNQDGRPIRSRDLAGKFWVADFVFTSCPTICPTLTRKMAGLQEHYRNDAASIGFLSFSIDPDVDVPEKLRAFAQVHGARTANWHFLTGDAAGVTRVVRDGFRLALGVRAPRADGRYDILHSGHFVLIDDQRRIRGYFPTSSEGLALLGQHLNQIRDEGPSQ